MSKINSIWKFLKKKKYWIIGILGALLVGWFMFGGSEAPLETVSPVQADLVRTVRISGKVTPREKVDLGFEVSGTVAGVNRDVGERVSRGQVLVSLGAGTTAAEIQRSEAELASAQAELNKLDGSQIYQSNVTGDKRSVVQAIRDAYTAASDAVHNKADQVFIDANTDHPEIIGYFKNFDDLHSKVNTGRVEAGTVLDQWGNLVASLGASTYTDAQLEISKTYLSKISDFIANLTRAVNAFEVTSYSTQAQIDDYKSAILSARESINTANQGFINAENGLAETLSSVPIQVSRVEAAQASLLNLRYQLAKSALISPISGIISRQDAKVGQGITAGTSIVSVISPDYIIETYVPEVSIPGMNVGNIATVTFDAYGPDVTFPAKVDHIDPAETVRDGVSTYKVKLSFTTTDERIRSGLTSNVSIEIMRKTDTTLIPTRAITKEDAESFVYVLVGEKKMKKTVVVGEKDSQGNIELLSGLSLEDKIIVNP